MSDWLLPSLAATERFGRDLGSLLRPGHVVALVGDLGAGKTTLAQAIGRGMGVTSHISSPTFGLVHEYHGPVPLFHFDPYRLQRGQDLTDLGFHEFFDRGGVVLVEWADRFLDLLPADRLTLTLELDVDSLPVEIDAEAPRRLRAVAAGGDHLRVLADLAAAPELQDLLVS